MVQRLAAKEPFNMLKVAIVNIFRICNNNVSNYYVKKRDKVKWVAPSAALQSFMVNFIV